MSETTGLEPVYSILGSDPDLCELVEMFVGEIPNRIDTLTQALAKNDLETVERTAHQLKGALGSYGFDSLTTVAAQLETTARDHSAEHDQLELAVSELVNACLRMRHGTPD